MQEFESQNQFDVGTQILIKFFLLQDSILLYITYLFFVILKPIFPRKHINFSIILSLENYDVNYHTKYFFLFFFWSPHVLIYFFFTQTETELRNMVNDVDQNDNGMIEFNEFLQMMSKKMREGDSEDELREAFK